MATLASPSLQNLITDVRVQLNSQDPTNSFWSDPEISGYLGDAIRRYFVMAVMDNEGYFTTQTDLNVVAATETIALPSDFFQIKNVWKKVTNGYISLTYRNMVAEGYISNSGTSGDSYIPVYYFQGNNLVLRPTPSYSETAGIRIEYTQFPTTMVYGGDTMTSQVSPIFKELIVMYAVYKAKLRESMVNGGNMHTVPAGQVQALYDEFKTAIAKRSKNPTFVIPFNP